MKNKKNFGGMLIGILIMLIISFPVFSSAATLNPPLYFGITEVKPNSDPSLGFSIGDPKSPTNGPKLWNIVQFSDNSYSDPTPTSNVYCIRGGFGFSLDENGKKQAEYTNVFDFKKDKEQITDQKVVDLINRTTTVEGKQVNAYDAIVAMSDLLYIPELASSEEDKKVLLENAGCSTDPGYPNIQMSDTLIEAVQQAAIWYYTNADEPEFYQKYDDTSLIWYTADNGKTYDNLENYNPTSVPPHDDAHVGESLQRQAISLYRYLIKESAERAGKASSKTEITLYTNLQTNAEQPLIKIEKKGEFDLALRKYITKVDGTPVNVSRVPNIEQSTIETKGTATYKHKKDPVVVKQGSTVTYNLTVYNEGDIAGRASKIVDQLPTGLKSKLATGATVTSAKGNVYTISYDENTNKITLETTGTNNLNSYDGTNLDSDTIEIECKVESAEVNKVLTNVAWISEEIDEDGLVITNKKGDDKDSEPSTIPSVNKDNMEDYKGTTSETDLSKSETYYPGQQDDDDFEKVKILGNFDLKLIKRITEVNGKEVPNRIESIDITKLADGTATTADYKLTKTPVSVEKGDLVKYTIRVYNEGNLDGYAQEITDDLPEGLEFLAKTLDTDESKLSKEEKEAIEFNLDMNWSTFKGEDGKTYIKTDYLAKGKGEELIEEGANLIKAFDSSKEYSDTEGNKNPDYREVSVILKVVSEDTNKNIIRNEAAITEDADKNGNPVDDRDSKPEEWVKYEDDEDYDNIILQKFDLALRKFITDISGKEVTTRVPEVNYDKEKKQISYTHPKTPLEVVTGDVVTYTIRVFNEGSLDGYAKEIMDDLPDGLEFLPENEINTQYRWVMYREVEKDEKLPEDAKTISRGDKVYIATEKAEEADIILTDYLSKEQEKTAGENLLTAFNPDVEISDTNPAHKDVKVAFKVVEPNGSDKILINSAQISDDSDKEGNPVEDEDSIPGKWNEGEDDQDKEYVKLTYFDLALRKWVTQAIVIKDGKETITQTGHTPEMDPEPPVKVDIHKKDLNKVTVKFRYSIRVTNEGDIAGYVKEITDYIPEGLKFEPKDNPGWKDEGNNIISTRLLENKLLQPGESADVSVLLTWINNQDNLGLKTNTAEISEDDNDKKVPDKDSTPDNKKPGEDDIDDAPVILSISTGQVRIYYTLGFAILVTIAGGIVLIKRFVL